MMRPNKKSVEGGSSEDPPVPLNPLAADVNEFYWEKFLNDITEAKNDFPNFPLLSKFRAIASVMENKNMKSLCLTLAYESPELLYNLTDAFSDFQVLASQRKEQNKHLFCLGCFMDYTTLIKIKNELDKIKKELEDIEDNKIKNQERITYGLTYSDPGNIQQIIGLDEHVENIKKYLRVHDSSETPFRVKGIYGMCGTGKTALAQILFNDQTVCKTFYPRIWICCSHTMVEQLDRTKVMKIIFEELGYDFDELNGLGITELLAAMKRLLNRKRYLLVVDDVWGADEWFANLGDNPEEDSNKERFSDGLPRNSGGAVLLTCRNPDAAKKMVGEKNLYNLEPLNEESCEKIFHKYMKEYNINLDEKRVSEYIPHCHGLPLAAKEIAVWEKTRSTSESSEDNI